ncbi:CRISPR-associated endonuclease Cas1 [bacterium M00.F.Ca.ET.230.01.1.1]|nr:CRISPR-associated endonuclease Cas1 [bacterium M00.F.Ca.ET.230.01.1.1]
MRSSSPAPISKAAPVGDADWQIRSDEWLQKYQKMAPFRSAKSRADWPLILTGHGVSLRVERDTLLIKNGFTHYPQQQEVLRFFPGALTLPSRIIFLECSGSISFEVLAWLQKQKVELLHLNWQGDVVATTTSAGYSGQPEKMEWQWTLRNNSSARQAFCRSLIHRKIQNSLSNLEFMNFESWDWGNACAFLKNALWTLDKRPPQTIEELLGLEGNCAAMYFRAWRSVTLAWRISSRRFIPANWGGYDQRSSMATTRGNAKATHPINAILNYAYRVKESDLLVRCLAEGFDPRIGILHEIKEGRNSFLCDLIELERAGVDLKVFEFVRTTAFEVSDFVVGPDGVVRLNPQMARYIAGLISKGAVRDVADILQLDG